MVPPVTALLVGLAPAVALTYSKSIVTNVILARAAMPRGLTLVCVLRVEEVRVRARQGATDRSEGAAAWSVERGAVRAARVSDAVIFLGDHVDSAVREMVKCRERFGEQQWFRSSM